MDRLHIYSDGLQEKMEFCRQKILDIGERVDLSIEKMSEARRKIVEPLIYLPLIFWMMFWMELAPFSDYWILDLPFVAIRYIGMFVMLAPFRNSIGPLVIFYIEISIDYLVAWLQDMTYWMFKSEADQVCYQESVLPCGDFWWSTTLLSIGLGIIYVIYVSGSSAYFIKDDAVYVIKYGWLFTVPSVICIFGYFSLITVPLMYWTSKLFFTAVITLRIMINTEMDKKCDEQKMDKLLIERFAVQNDQGQQEISKKIELLHQKKESGKDVGKNMQNKEAGHRMSRAVLVFGAMYLAFALMVEILNNDKTLEDFISYEFYVTIIASRCTNFVVVASIAFWFGYLSETALNIITYGQGVARPISYQVQMFVIVLCLEANILISDDYIKFNNMKAVFFLTFYEVIIHVLNYVEPSLLNLVNSRTDRVGQAKLWFVLLIITAGPTYVTFNSCDPLGVSAWLLLNASGNFVLIVRVVFMLSECTLILLSWQFTNNDEIFGNMLLYTRIVKSFVTCFVFMMYSYYRLIAPFLSGFFILRVVFTVLYFFFAIIGMCKLEWDKYQSRTYCVNILKEMPDMYYDIDVEECSVCYTVLEKGKQLPCGHVFHYDCLKRWFNVKTVCPFCKTEVKKAVPNEEKKEN